MISAVVTKLKDSESRSHLSTVRNGAQQRNSYYRLLTWSDMCLCLVHCSHLHLAWHAHHIYIWNICCLSDMSTLHLAPAVSALQLLQSGILSFHPSKCVPAPTPSAITSRPTISSRPSNPLSAFLLCLRSGFGCPLCTITNSIYLLTARQCYSRWLRLFHVFQTLNS